VSIGQASVAMIENIYFSVKFHDNFNDWISKNVENFNLVMKRAYTDEDKFLMLDNEEFVQVIGGIQRYPFGFSVKNKYRIYFASKTTDNYEVYIIVSAQFMHTHNVFQCINIINNTLELIILAFDPAAQIEKVDYKLSRIDICNHNNFIQMDKYIKENEYNSRVVTKIRTVQPYIHLHGETEQETNYFIFSRQQINFFK
jgi:hypothetical protein